MPAIHLRRGTVEAVGQVSIEEAQALLFRNFRVGGARQSDCADWLTAVTRDLLRPSPSVRFFVILALFLPQLLFGEGVRVDSQLWLSPVIQSEATAVQVGGSRIARHARISHCVPCPFEGCCVLFPGNHRAAALPPVKHTTGEDTRWLPGG